MRSAGILLDLTRRYVAKNVLEVLKEYGIDSIDEVSREITEQDLIWADKIIIVANNIDKDIFKDKDVEIWKIEDCSENDIDKIREIVKKIDKMVKELNEYL